MKKKISFLLALVMIISLLPAMGVSAATTSRIDSVPRIASDKTWASSPGTAPRLQLEFTSNSPGGSVYLELTSGNAEWKFDELASNASILAGAIVGDGNGWWDYTGDYTTTGGNVLVSSYLVTGGLSFRQVSTTLVELKVPADFSKDDYIYFPLVVEATDSGDLEVSVSGPPVTSNTLTFAIATSGATTMTVSKVESFSDELTIANIVIAETRAGSFNAGKNTIKLTAPSGFEWASVGTLNFTGGLVGGSGGTLDSNGTTSTDKGDATLAAHQYGLVISGNDYQTLEIRYNLCGGDVDGDGVDDPAVTSPSGRMVLSGAVLRSTDDARYGDVSIKISGAGTTGQTVLAGTYVTYGITLTAEDKDLPVIYAGDYPEDWDDDSIKSLEVTFAEETVESWFSKRKTNFSVNDGVKIRGVKFTKFENLTSNFSNDEVIVNDYIAYDGSNNKLSPASSTAEFAIDIEDGTKFTSRNIIVNSTNNKKAKIKMELYLSAEPGYTGPVTFTVAEDSGTSTKDMSVDIATIESPISIETTSTDVSLGYQRIPVADILIKENGAGAIKEAGTHVFGDKRFGYDPYNSNNYDSSRSDLFVFLEDMSIDKDSSQVTIEDGDMTLDKTRFVDGGLAIQPKRESSDPTTIAITGTTVTLNRVLAQGNYELRVGGSVCANYSSDSKLRFATFDKDYYVAMDNYAVVVTPADVNVIKNAIGVTVGSNTLRVGTQTVEMDTAPFLETSGAYAYMMVPARFVTEAVGASISFDANTKTATVFTSDNRITTFQVGTNYITVNGTRVPITGPSVLIRDSRIFLPFRVLGEQVLGVEVGWDEPTQSATYIPAGADASVLGVATATTPVADTTTDETTDETEAE